jgi:hypothetical protein
MDEKDDEIYHYVTIWFLLQQGYRLEQAYYEFGHCKIMTLVHESML